MRIRGNIPFSKTARTLGGATDPIPSIQGVALYFDGFNSIKKEDTGNPTWTSSGNNVVTATQTLSGDYPTIATGGKGWDFSNDDHFDLDKKVYSTIGSGFRWFFVLDRTIGGDDLILGTQASEAGDLNYFFIRNSTVSVVTDSGPAATFTSTTIGTDLCIVEVNYVGGTWTIYKDGNLLKTVVQALTVSPGFDVIGTTRTNTTQGFDGNLRAMVVYNGQDSSDITTIRSTLQAKYIDETLDADVEYSSYTTNPVDVTASIGDSQTAGRDLISNLTSPTYDYLLDVITGAKINTTLLSGGYEDYDIDTTYLEELPSSLGPEASFIYERKQAETYVAHFKYGVGGSTLGTSGGANKMWSRTDDDLFPKAVRAYKIFEQELRQNFFDPTFTACVFHIGGNDASDPTDAGNFQANLIQFMSDLNTYVWGVDAKYRGYAVLVGADLVTVNAAWSTVAGSDADLTYSTYSESVPVLGDSHYEADGCALLGIDAYDNWYSGL